MASVAKGLEVSGLGYFRRQVRCSLRQRKACRQIAFCPLCAYAHKSVASSPHNPAGLVAHRVLVVEDDADIQEAMLDILREEGFVAQAASHGQEALDILHARTFSPDVIILDLMMPVMDGWTFCKAQQADARLVQIPIIVVSADRNAEQKAEKMGAKAYMAKPVDLPRLLQLLNALSSNSKAAASA